MESFGRIISTLNQILFVKDTQSAPETWIAKSSLSGILSSSFAHEQDLPKKNGIKARSDAGAPQEDGLGCPFPFLRI
jgi:hypothetical protein